jgi:flagellar biosynthesis protein
MKGNIPLQNSSAVALRYDGKGAPKVTAKGEGPIGEKIIELAHQHGIPLHEDPALASLLSAIPLGEEIPENLYVAIAEVLAFVYYLSGKVPQQTQDRD